MADVDRVTRPDPLDRFAPWPQLPEDVTADALIRHAAVRAHGALALAAAGHDVPRQLARAMQYFVAAQLLLDLAHDPVRAERAARQLWARIGDGACVAEAIRGWLTAADLDPDEIARVAVEAYQARADTYRLRVVEASPR